MATRGWPYAYQDHRKSNFGDGDITPDFILHTLCRLTWRATDIVGWVYAAHKFRRGENKASIVFGIVPEDFRG